MPAKWESPDVGLLSRQAWAPLGVCVWLWCMGREERERERDALSCEKLEINSKIIEKKMGPCSQSNVLRYTVQTH